jgi:hypothetical protein
MGQNVNVNVPADANQACLRLGVALPTLAEIGLRVVCQAARENNLTVATTRSAFFGPEVVTVMDLGSIARELEQQGPVPDGPPTI